MTSLFEITTSANTIDLDQSRSGAITFTVTNVSGRPLAALAMWDTSTPALLDWLTITGDTQHRFAANETHQYSAQINVPPGAPAGNYTFSLRVIEEENPDENVSDSPVVRLQVPELVQKEKGGFPLWILAVVAGVLLVILVSVVLWATGWLNGSEGDDADEPPDLVITEFSLFGSIFCFQPAHGEITVANIGGSESGPFTIRVEFGRDVNQRELPSPAKSEVVVASLEPSETVTVDLPPMTFAGRTRYPGEVVVDSNDQVDEADETNNERRGDLETQVGIISSEEFCSGNFSREEIEENAILEP